MLTEVGRPRSKDLLPLVRHSVIHHPYFRTRPKLFPIKTCALSRFSIVTSIKQSKVMRLSGLQRSVLSLYRQCLREARRKPAVSRSMAYDYGDIVPTHPGYSEQFQEFRQVGLHSKFVTCVDVERMPFTCRSHFRQNLDIDKKDFSAIEYLLRKGRRQLELYSEPGITNIG